MAFIEIVDLTFAYEGSSDYVFENVSFRMDTDWRLGFTGRNGRGKTTFLRLLMDQNQRVSQRTYEYSGTISSGVKFEYFPYETGDPNRMTLEIAESLLPGLTEPGEIWKIFRELSLLAVGEEALYRPFSTLSHGERTKILLALLFLKENRFLLIDEPTNHLDAAARELLGDYLKRKRGFILVSHDRRLLDACTDHTLAVNKTNIEIQKGNFSSWQENKRRQDAFELAENERLKKEIGRLKTAVRQSKEWADSAESLKLGRKSAEKFGGDKSGDLRVYMGEKSRRMQMRRKNLERRQNREIEEKAGLLKNLESAEELRLFPMEYRADRLLHLDHVTAFYGKKQVLKDFSMEICCGERIALTGRNGCGKSTVLKLIASGRLPSEMGVSTPEITSGRLEIGSQLVISYVPQDTGFLKGGLGEFAKQRGIDSSLLNTLLRKLDFSREQLMKDMEEYSEGQKKKVLLAASLLAKAHLYVWDEPLNYIDVYSRIQVEELILKYQPTLLFVEHDREFVSRAATRIIEF